MPRPEFGLQATSSQPDINSLAASELPTTVPNWLQAYERWSKGSEWGFVGLRTCCYDDEEKWQAFRSKLDAIARLPFEADKNVRGVTEAGEHFSLRWIEDSELEGASLEKLQDIFAAHVPSLSIGQSQRVFLTATPDIVEHFLAIETPDLGSRRWRPDAPYVLVAAASSDPGLEEGHEEREWFREVFKVAAETLIDEFWFALEGIEWPVRKVTRGIKGVELEGGEVKGAVGEGDDMWWSTIPSPEKMRRRRGFG